MSAAVSTFRFRSRPVLFEHSKDRLNIVSPQLPAIVALDGMTQNEALDLARRLEGEVWGFKVNDLLLRAGVELIPRLRHYGKVFCDPKLHDIPNTVANDVRILGEAGAGLVTLQCSGGLAMLDAAIEARVEGCGLLGVTVLTAMPTADVDDVYHRGPSETVRDLARLALEVGLDGIVSSPLELNLISGCDPQHRLLRVIPGIRPHWCARPDDQQRFLAPGEAWRLGADLLVIGRPITRAKDPAAACRRLAEELPPGGMGSC